MARLFGKVEPPVVAVKIEDECRTCLFFYFRETPSETTGSCHRYPTPQQTPAAYWCGEYKRDPDDANYTKR